MKRTLKHKEWGTKHLRYTGEVDKAGVKVFEGDIISMGGGIKHVVRYRKNIAVLCLLDLWHYILDEDRTVGEAANNYKIYVIGNVWEDRGWELARRTQ